MSDSQVIGLEANLALELFLLSGDAFLNDSRQEDYLRQMEQMEAGELLEVIRRAKELLENKHPQFSGEAPSLYINKDFRIFIGSPQGLEIEMRPMSKAVFLLFLRHPEGIEFKRIGMFEEELSMIYRHICRNDNPQQVERSLRKVLDAGSRAVNVAAARSARALAEYVSDDMLPGYTISGGYARPKAIRLDRRLVCWEQLISI